MANKSKTLARRKTGVGRTKTRTPVTRSISQHAKGVKKVLTKRSYKGRSPHKKASYRGKIRIFPFRKRKAGGDLEVTAPCLNMLTGTPPLNTAQRLYLQEQYGDTGAKWCPTDGYTSYAHLIGMTGGVDIDRQAQIVSKLEDLGE